MIIYAPSFPFAYSPCTAPANNCKLIHICTIKNITETFFIAAAVFIQLLIFSCFKVSPRNLLLFVYHFFLLSLKLVCLNRLNYFCTNTRLFICVQYHSIPAKIFINSTLLGRKTRVNPGAMIQFTFHSALDRLDFTRFSNFSRSTKEEFFLGIHFASRSHNCVRFSCGNLNILIFYSTHVGAHEFIVKILIYSKWK